MTHHASAIVETTIASVLSDLETNCSLVPSNVCSYIVDEF